MTKSEPVAVPERWIDYLQRTPETGMGYQVADVWLTDGRQIKQVVITNGYITRVRGQSSVPFTSADIKKIQVTHKKWDFNREREERKG